MARVACLGSALQDIYLIDKKDFEPTTSGGTPLFHNIKIGSKIDVDHACYHVGGGGSNAAVTFSRHGHETILLTNIARDMAGEAILEQLDHENIDSSYVRLDTNANTGCSVILVDEEKGERTILTHRGIAAKFDNISAKNLEMICPDWLYITTTGGDFETLHQFCDQAKKLHCSVMFNPGQGELSDKKQLIKILEKVDVLLVNKEEAKQIVNGELIDELLEKLNRYVKTVIVTASVMGGIATNGEETIRFGLYSHINAIDTTGAGDAFGAGFLAHQLEGHNFEESLIFASANANSVVSQLGAQTGILTGLETLHPMPLQNL